MKFQVLTFRTLSVKHIPSLQLDNTKQCLTHGSELVLVLQSHIQMTIPLLQTSPNEGLRWPLCFTDCTSESAARTINRSLTTEDLLLTLFNSYF